MAGGWADFRLEMADTWRSCHAVEGDDRFSSAFDPNHLLTVISGNAFLSFSMAPSDSALPRASSVLMFG